MSALDVEYLNSSEMPTFLNEMALKFPENSRERINLIECSIYIAVVRNVLEKSRQKEPRVGIRREKGEPVPCVEFQK